MNLATEIFTIYQELYTESTNEFWADHAERLGYSVEILKEIFQPKEGEYEVLQEFVDQFLEHKVLLRELLETYHQRSVDILEINSMREMFLSIIENMDAEEIQEIVEDDEPWAFSVGICEGIFMVLEESLYQLMQEGY